MSGMRLEQFERFILAHLATQAEFDAALAMMERDFRTQHGITQPFYVAFGRK